MFALAFAPPALAQGLGGFSIHAFQSEIEIRKDGSFVVTETIRGEFSEPRHGIFRFIPSAYEEPDGSGRITPIRVLGVRRLDPEEGNRLSEPYEAYQEGDFQVIKVGRADRTVQGPFEYELRYQVENALLYHETTDELSWDVTGDRWSVPLPEVSASVTVEGFGGEFLADCFTGPAGSTEKDCRFRSERGRMTVTGSGPMTISVTFPKSLVEEPGTHDRLRWWFAGNWDYFLLLIPLATAIVLFHVWWHHGRDPKGRGTVIAEYGPPAGLRPLEVGTLVDARVHSRDFSAAIVDLAVRGYLRIIEDPGGEYALKRSKEPDDALRPYEKEILSGLFDGRTEVRLRDRKAALALTRDQVSDMAYQDMAGRGYFVRNPKHAKAVMFGIGIATVVLAHFFGIIAWSVTERPVAHFALFGTAAMFLILAPFMPKKTEKGAVAHDIARGFKLYLGTAEKYRIEWQEKEGIFEAFLPYAIVFGIADKWAEALKDEISQAPGWYAGPRAGKFDPVGFVSGVSGFADAAAKVSAPSGSGGSVGGGGFSGGGFGGGGGGSW